MASSKTVLLEFRAGKLTATKIEGSEKYNVVADDTKGKIELVREGDAVHFLWKNRYTGEASPDFTIIPGNQKVTKVDTKREKDRVFLLQFSGASAERFFFWMQEPDASKDDELIAKLNRILESRAPAARAGAGGAAGGNLNQEALMQLLSGLGPGGAGAAQSAPVDQAAMMGDLSSILQNMGLPVPPEGQQSGAGDQESKSDESKSGEDTDTTTVAETPSTTRESAATPGAPTRQPRQEATSAAEELPTTATPAAAGSQGTSGISRADLDNAFLGASRMFEAMQGQQQPRTPGLHEVIGASPAAMMSIVDDQEVQNELLQFLPEGRQTVAELRDTLQHSPQLRQAMGQLTAALHSDNFNMIMANFGLDPSAGAAHLARGDATGAFLAAIQQSVGNGSTDPSATNNDDDDFYA